MSELFSKLGIDWKLLLAQVINFFILLWILKRYAYKPILGALQKRSTTIAKSLDEAKQIDVQVKQLADEKVRVIRQARVEAIGIVDQARKDAEAFAASTRAQAQAQSAEIVAAAKKEVVTMKDEVMADAKSDLADLVVAATEKVVRMKVEGTHDRKMVEEFLRKAGS